VNFDLFIKRPVYNAKVRIETEHDKFQISKLDFIYFFIV
jgi:hypothetical protein